MDGDQSRTALQKAITENRNRSSSSTRPRGTNYEEDKNLALELLQSQKEVREHDLVLERIENVLNQFCDKITRKSYREILKLRQVQHLLSRIEGHLNPDHGESTLINAIHPPLRFVEFQMRKLDSALNN